MDEDLAAIERIQGGDEGGLRELMARHKDAVFRFILRYTGNETDAAELAEETFYRVYKHAGRYRPRAKVRTWMFSIAANLGRDHARRRKKWRGHLPIAGLADREENPSIAEMHPSDSATPDTQMDSREQIRLMEAAISSLPHKLRFPFVFCVLEGNSHDECAGVLGTSRKAVETRIYRARKTLRHQLSGLFEGF